MRITTILLLLLLVSSSTSFTAPSIRIAPRIQYNSFVLKQSRQDEDDTRNQRAEMKHFFDEVEQERMLLHSSMTPQLVPKVKSQQEQDVWNARLLLLGAAALYGTNFSVVKLLGEVMPVGAMGTLRFGLAALATLPFLVAKPRSNSDLTTTLAATLAGLEVGMWNSFGYVAQAIGLESTPASESAFLCSLAVVIVPLLDQLTGKKLSMKQIVGATMAVVGVAFLELGGGPMHSFTSGEIASLIQPFAFGIGFWKMEQAMRSHSDEASRIAAAQLFAIFCTSAAFCTVGGNVPDMTQIMAWLTDPVILGALVWTGAITTALTVYMETVALKTLSAAETTLIFSTEPMWGAAFAAVVMGEQFGVSAIAGGGLILAGCLVSNLGLDGMRNILKSPGMTTGPMGHVMSSGVMAAIGGWVTSMTPGVEMVEASELAVVEEVISKATDVL